VTDARRSQSGAERGTLTLLHEMTNQKGELVWHATVISLVRTRPAAPSS
jgi:hypothetical protein